MGAKFGPGDAVRTRTVWDGVSWLVPYKPFCTLRCALHYARKAYEEGRARAAERIR
jgi:hypothetical protein